MAPSMIRIAFIATLVAVSASTFKFAPSSSLSTGAFELYSNLIDSPPMAAPTKIPLAQQCREGTEAIALRASHGPLVKQSRGPGAEDGSRTAGFNSDFSMTEGQFEEVLGSALDVKFNLKVLADKAGEEPEYGLTGNSDIEPKVLGQIPVHLKVHHLTIGGVLMPTMTSESTNVEKGLVNYGNLHVC